MAKIEMIVMYKECLHNHAAQSMGYVTDGCGLFEASGPYGTPEAMLCAACRCHWNFRRRVEVDVPQSYDAQTEHNKQRDGVTIPSLLPNPQQPQVLHQQTSATTSMPRGLGVNPDPWVQKQAASTSRAPTSLPSSAAIARQEIMNQPQGLQNPTTPLPVQVRMRERRRRITREQSERLKAIEESNGWKMFCEYSKEEITSICSHVGITRPVLNNWISNQRRKQAASNAASN